MMSRIKTRAKCMLVVLLMASLFVFPPSQQTEATTATNVVWSNVSGKMSQDGWYFLVSDGSKIYTKIANKGVWCFDPATSQWSDLGGERMKSGHVGGGLPWLGIEAGTDYVRYEDGSTGKINYSGYTTS